MEIWTVLLDMLDFKQHKSKNSIIQLQGFPIEFRLAAYFFWIVAIDSWLASSIFDYEQWIID